MNTIGIIILTVLLFEFICNLIANYLNLRAMHPNVPGEFADVYNAEAYQKSQEYTKVKTRFGLVVGTIDLAILLLFWWGNGFNYLDTVVRKLELPFIWTGLGFIGILILFKSVLTLPASIYSTFVIEERFGFNKTTVRTFIMDILKSILLGLGLGGPLVAGILAFFAYSGDSGWLYCWIATTLFMLGVQFIAPIWILPLLNKFTPLADGELRTAILSYADSAGFSLKDVYVMDGSKRSSKSNAFFTGFGKNKRIALFDTLIAKHTVEEIVAVLAHEIGHYKKKHIIQGIIISIIHMGIMFYLMSLFINTPELFSAFYLTNISVYAGLIFFGMLFAPIELLVSIGMQILSRKNEYEADRFAAKTTKKPEQMISALKKLSLDNLSNLTPHPFYVFLHYSHPPMLERIAEMRKNVTNNN